MEVAAAEGARLVASVESLLLVNLETMFAVSMDVLMARDTAAETISEKSFVTQATANILCVCTFVAIFVGGWDFLSVGSCLETLSATFMEELQPQQSLTGGIC